MFFSSLLAGVQMNLTSEFHILMKERFRVAVLITRPFFHCDPTVRNFMDLYIQVLIHQNFKAPHRDWLIHPVEKQGFLSKAKDLHNYLIVYITLLRKLYIGHSVVLGYFISRYKHLDVFRCFFLLPFFLSIQFS